MVQVRTRGQVVEADADALRLRIASGQTHDDTAVLAEDGAWHPARQWFLETFTIRAPAHSDEATYVARHTAQALDFDALHAFLGVQLHRDDLRMERSSRLAMTQRIDVPAWAAAPIDISHASTPIADFAALRGNGPGESATIHMPAWGAPFVLPTVDSIEVPPWQDPATAGLALPSWPVPVWRRARLVPQGAPPRPEARPQAPIGRPPGGADPRVAVTTPPVAVADPSASASKRAARREAKRKRDLQAAGVEDQPADVPRRSAAPPEGPPPGRSSSREAQAEPPAPPAATSDASSPGVQSGLHWGIGGCLGTAIGLAIVAFAAAMAVDAALQAFVTSDVARTVAAALDDGASAPRRRAVEGPLVLGPPQGELTVAVAFDPSERAGALAVAEVLAWVDAQQASFAPERAPRVVLLPVAGGEDETPVRTVLALRHLGVPDDAWRAPLAEARALSMTDLAAIASAHAIAEDNLKRAAASAEIELQLRSTRSIARAFGLGPPAGVAVHGVALPVTAWASSATLAQALAPALQRVVDARAIVGDDDARQAAVLGDLPPAQASRWQRWILRGERVEAGSEPEAAEPPPSPAAAVAPQPALLQPPVSAPRRGGPADAAVQIVFVADLHCPFSRRTWDVLRQIERDFGDDVSLVFVHRPIDKLHPQARAAARHAVAAHDQGRFWDAIDWYFGKRKAKDAELAAALELDAAGAAALAAAAAGATTAATVEEHVAWARDQGVTGTPTTFVDGLALRGAQTFRRIQSAVEQAIQARASGRGAAPAPQP